MVYQGRRRRCGIAHICFQFISFNFFCLSAQVDRLCGARGLFPFRSPTTSLNLALDSRARARRPSACVPWSSTHGKPSDSRGAPASLRPAAPTPFSSDLFRPTPSGPSASPRAGEPTRPPTRPPPSGPAAPAAPRRSPPAGASPTGHAQGSVWDMSRKCRSRKAPRLSERPPQPHLVRLLALAPASLLHVDARRRLAPPRSLKELGGERRARDGHIAVRRYLRRHGREQPHEHPVG